MVNADRPSILDVASDIERATGTAPFTPRWEATVRAFYGLELRERDLAELELSTRRSKAELRRMAGELSRRRFNELWCRVGRRGRKSFTAALIAVYEAVFGKHERYLVHRERGLIAIISKDSAGSTLVADFCEIHAQALGLETRWTSIGNVSVLEIAGVPFGIACFPCNAKAPRGYAIPVIVADEIAHWATDSDEYTNSDKAVLGAVKPAMAQFPDAKLIAISSPLGRDGTHYETIERNLGDESDPAVLAVEGPTWLWNPEISEERTREVERDHETHAREFGAEPSDNEGTALVPSHVEFCFNGAHPGYFQWGRPIAALDLAQWTNTIALIVGRWGQPDKATHYKHRLPSPGSGLPSDTFVGFERDAHGEPIREPVAERPLFEVFEVAGWNAETLRTTPMDRILAEVAEVVRSSGADTVLADGYGARFAAALLSQHGVSLRAFAPTNDSINEAVVLLRMLMRDRQLAIVEHEQMQKDLLTFPRTISGGTFKFGKRRGGGKHHWDFASALVTMAHGFLEERGSDVSKTHFIIEGAPTIQSVGGRKMVAGR